MAASANGHLRCLRALIGGADGDGDGEGRDNVGGGGARDHPEQLAVDLDAPDSEGRTALMHACMFDQVGVTWGDQSKVAVSGRPWCPLR